MRIFAGGIATESNTFVPMPTGINDFQTVRASDVTMQRTLADLCNFGFASTIEVFRSLTVARGWDFIFGLYAFAQPAGTTTRPTYESLRSELLDSLQTALPVDAILLSLHGAMVADGYDDCEADLVQRVRAIVGPNAKIGVELDLHCDVAQQMVDDADAIVIFKEYPHIDVNDRASDLFALIADAVTGQTTPTMARFDCRMIGMYLTPVEPMRSFVDGMLALEGKAGVLSVSLAHGFPFADVPSAGSSTLVVTDGNQQQAAEVAETLGRHFFALRHAANIKVAPLHEALDQVLASDGHGKPIVITDRSDNAGGGAPSDSTFVLAELLRRGATNVGFAMLWDPIVVQLAMSAGMGSTLAVRLGGKMGPTSGDPLDLLVEVRGIVPNLVQLWPQKSGVLESPCGDTVHLHCNGIDIIVNSKRTQVLGLEVFTAFGIQPHERRWLFVKSTQHFYAAYAPIAAEVVYIDPPGTLNHNFVEVPYRRVTKDRYPWVENPFV